MTGTEKIILNTTITKQGKKWFIYLLQGNTKIGEAHILINNKTNAFLEVIEIEKEYQNQGYGNLLMYKIFEICDSEKIKSLSLFANFQKENLKSFYQKLGFKCNNKNIYKYEINIESAIKNLEKQNKLSLINFIPINPSDGNKPGTSGMVKKDWDWLQNLKIELEETEKHSDLTLELLETPIANEPVREIIQSKLNEIAELEQNPLVSKNQVITQMTEDFEEQSSYSFN